MNNTHNHPTPIGIHLAQYMEFKTTCSERDIEPSEILALWHTYQLSRNTQAIYNIGASIDNLSSATDNIYATLNGLGITMSDNESYMLGILQALNQLVSEIEHR